MHTRDLANRIAIVTGSGQGIGRATATVLAERGAHVIVNDIIAESAEQSCDLIQQTGGFATPFAGDVSTKVFVEQMIEHVMESFGTVDILINNAGILRPTRLPSITEEEWDIVMASNLKSTFLCSQAVSAVMMKKKWGRIVNVSSTAGKNVSTLGGVHYTAAKAGILGLTRAFAKEMASFNIRINAVCPGLIDTEMVRTNVAPNMLVQYAQSFPISRLGEPREVAELICFLTSDESNYITGAAIDINGGDLMV